MQYSLRSLMIVVAIVPPLVGGIVLFAASMLRPSNLIWDPLPKDFDLPHYAGGATSVETPDVTFELPDSQAPAPNPPKP